MESARLVIALLERTVNILVSTKFTEEKRRKRKFCYKPMALKTMKTTEIIYFHYGPTLLFC